MIYGKCRLCNYEDDHDYLHLLYDGRGDDCVMICEKCRDKIFPDRERSKREDRYIGGYFPPPWNMNEHPEKTEGWIIFQEEQRKNPKYYGCGALNIVETQ